MSVLSTLLEGIIYGLSLGMVYALVALGLTLIFGLMDVINFAHGAMVTLGAYLGITFIGLTDSFWLSLVLVALVVGVLGAVIERIAVKRLYDVGHLYQLLLTFGIALVIEGLIIIEYGAGSQQLSIPSLLQGDAIPIGPATIPRYRIFLILFTALLVVLVWLLIQQTKLGLIIKAGIQDRERTRLLGIRLGRINVLVFGIGSGMAAAAGLLAGPLLGVNPSLGSGLLIIGFVVVVIGGLGNVRGTIISGLLLGVVYNVTLFFYPTYANAMIFVAMAVVLMIRPQGLFEGVSS